MKKIEHDVLHEGKHQKAKILCTKENTQNISKQCLPKI